MIKMPRKGRSNLTGIADRKKARDRMREKRAQERDHTSKFASILTSAPLMPPYAIKRENRVVEDHTTGGCSIHGANRCPEGGHGKLVCQEMQSMPSLVTTVEKVVAPIDEEIAHMLAELDIVIVE